MAITLDERYKDDLSLLKLHKKKLLIPGWAGEVDDVEAVYIAEELTRSQTLRRQWQVAKFTRYRRKITPGVVKRMATAYAEMPLTAVGTLTTRTDKNKTAIKMSGNIADKQLHLFVALENGHGRN